MPRLKRAMRAFVAVLVAAALVAASATYALLRPTLPLVDGRLTLAGLHAPVEVLRDRWGIPHIYAQNEDDLLFAQGYVHAQDRLWQMEQSRRAARGTLAELLGEDALPGDRLARTLGLAAAAEAEWQGLDAEARRVLAAYAGGVNAYLSAPGRRLPVEFSLLGLTPAPWQPQDTLAIARLLAWSMSRGWQEELMRARLVQAVGAERAAELDPALAGSAALSTGADGLQPNLLDAAREAGPWWRGDGLGGSAWAVAAERTVGGAPILAAAPLLPVQMPSAWYELQLAGGGYDVVGAGFPGLPGVAMGRNRTLAWGLTGAAADAVDLYVEHVRPGSPPQAEYRGQWEDVPVRAELIHVRGRAEPVRLAVYTTRHGPLISEAAANGLSTGSTDVSPASPPQAVQEHLALRWTGQGQPAALASGLLAVDRAASGAELQAALGAWAAPALLAIYAEAQGAIGAATAGMAPLRQTSVGVLPAAGWAAGGEWGPLAAAAEGLRTPPEGLLLAVGGALQPGEGAAAPAAQRIAALIAGRARLSAEDVQAMQCDVRGPAQPLLDQLLARPPQGWLEERTMPCLRAWDLTWGAESTGAGIFAVYEWRFVHNTLDDELGAGLVDAYLNASPGCRAAVEALARQPDSPWFDDRRTPEREDRAAIVGRSFADALDWLGRRFGDLPYEWSWGRVHNVTFSHPLARMGRLGQSGLLRLLLSRGAMRTGGAPDCVAATGADLARQMAVDAVPYRMIVDLSAGGQTEAVNSTGQSANPLSAHYADMIGPWRAGGYHPLLYEREVVRAARAGVLVLSPRS